MHAVAQQAVDRSTVLLSGCGFAVGRAYSLHNCCYKQPQEDGATLSEHTRFIRNNGQTQSGVPALQGMLGGTLSMPDMGAEQRSPSTTLQQVVVPKPAP
jgi:hypothetical protein